MFISIDWISFSFAMTVVQQTFSHRLWDRAGDALNEQFPLFYERMLYGHEFTPRVGRAPYNGMTQRDDNGVAVFANQRLEHGLVEIGGIGMDTLGGFEAELELLNSVQDRVTRLDVAVDIFTEVKPEEFCAFRTPGKFKAWSQAESQSGSTVYIGSRKSDRYARVYRYYEPHPRHQFLRVEHVLKAEQAKLAIAQLNEYGSERFIAMLGNTFGWNHEAWQTEENTGEALKAWRPERRQGKTVAWIYSQVIPALLKLHRDDILNMHQVWAEDILPELDKK